MAEVAITWRECPRDKIKNIRGYQAPEPYTTTIDLDFPNLLTGEEAAESIIEANVEADPGSWDAFDYIVEILHPDRLAGRYAVTINMEPVCEAHFLEEAA